MSLYTGCSMFLAAYILCALVPSIGSVGLVHEATPKLGPKNGQHVQDKKGKPKDKATPHDKEFIRQAAASPEIPVLDPATAGAAASHAQSELVDAVAAETKQSASAQEAAASMASGVVEKGSKLIEAAHAFIEKTASQATAEIKKKREDANMVAGDSAAFEKALQKQAKDDTLKVVSQLEKAATQDEIINAAEASDAAATNAITLAGKIREKTKQTTEALKMKAAIILTAQKIANQGITDKLNSVKPSIVSMAKDLEEVGKKVSTKINAKEAGDAIFKKTAQAATQLQQLVADFESQSRKITQDLDAATTAARSEVDALTAKTSVRSEEIAQQLVTSATQARTQLNSAKSAFVEACNHAVQIVNDAAAAVTPDDLFKTVEDTGSTKTNTQASSVAYKAILFALSLGILSVLVGLLFRPDKLLK